MDDWRILVVDDDEDAAHTIAGALATPRGRCEVVTSGAAALARCRKLEFDVVVTDVHMEGMDGIELLARLQKLQPDLPVIIFTGAASISAAVDAVKRGAHHYLPKPCEGPALRAAVDAAITARRRGRRPPHQRKMPTGTADLIGSSEAMAELRARIELVARSHSPVLIEGETGTGKELVACAIRASSPRSGAPLVTVNASAIPENLLESQMFGHVRGAFTGAHSAHRGLFSEADGGTLLLDEIGDMPLPLQAKLLRVLQSGEFRAVGSERTTQVDVRVLAATHRRLSDLVREGKFREDLFYRLNVVTITVPPLRSRSTDIAPLAAHFLESARQRAPESPARSLSPELVDVLGRAPWPGNVRELESTIERLVVLATREELTLADLGLQLEEAAVPASDPSDPRDPGDPSLERLIRKHVEAVLERAGGNKAVAAKMLGVDLSTLYRWQRKWTS